MDEWNGGLRNTVLLIRDTWFLEISIWQGSVFSAQYSSVPLFQHSSMCELGDAYDFMRFFRRREADERGDACRRDLRYQTHIRAF